jgi:hypothetical protein
VYNTNGLVPQRSGPNTDREFISPGRRSIWLIRAASPEEFATFDDFVKSYRDTPLEIDAAALRFRFLDPVYGRLAGGMDQGLTVRDQPVVYTGHSREGTLTTETILPFRP